MADVKVTAKVTTKMDITRPASRGTPSSRPSSPSKVRVAAQASPASTSSVRPRAKVSSSAQVGLNRKPSPKITTSTTAARHAAFSSVRSPSPLKQIESRSGRASPTRVSNARMRADAKATAATSVPPSPRISRPPSVIRSVPSESCLNGFISPRPRVTSVSSTSQVSTTSSAANHRANGLLAAVSSQEATSTSLEGAAIRVTSKVSGIVKRKPSGASSPLQAASSSTSPVPQTSRPKSPSPIVVNSTSTPPSPAQPQFYPITTATPAANVHRFNANRRPSSTFSRSPLPYSIDKPGQPSVTPKVDPASIPLPPLSPPSSIVSYSSRSSASLSNGSHSVASEDTVPLPYDFRKVNGHVRTFSHDSGVRDSLGVVGRMRSATELRVKEVDPTKGLRFANVYPSGVEEEEHKVRAEAKSNRKIADLEITNKSLLTINATLEETKHRQAREIRELKRKLRESRLVLPPRTFKQLQSEELDTSSSSEEEGDVSDVQSPLSSQCKEGRHKHEETYDRIRIMLENLLENGKRALDSTIADHSSPHIGTKVLHEVEARSWRNGGYVNGANLGDVSINIDEGTTETDTEDEENANNVKEEKFYSAPNSVNNSMRSEEEVEEMMQSICIEVQDGPSI